MKFWNVALFLALGGLNGAQADDLPFNEKEVPESLDDFRDIQKALKDHLGKARAATVCLKLENGSGSGVIINEEGLILTAAHVTAGVGKEMTVIMEDGTEYKGVSLGLQSETDAAMFKITDKGPFPFVDYDKGDTTKLGDWVFSLGHSGGFDKARGVNVRVGRLVREAESTIQSDCMLIGGDSGGPLFNMKGQVVGIHSRVGGSKEESMHVPLREFQKNWEGMLEKEFIGSGPFAKKVIPGTGFLGVVVEPSEEGGLKVTELWEESAAEKAGIKVGDRILEVAGEEATQEVFDAKLGALGAGDTLELKWISGEETKEEKIKLGERP